LVRLFLELMPRAETVSSRNSALRTTACLRYHASQLRRRCWSLNSPPAFTYAIGRLRVRQRLHNGERPCQLHPRPSKGRPPAASVRNRRRLGPARHRRTASVRRARPGCAR
jgi:hypothetical protein